MDANQNRLNQKEISTYLGHTNVNSTVASRNRTRDLLPTSRLATNVLQTLNGKLFVRRIKKTKLLITNQL